MSATIRNDALILRLRNVAENLPEWSTHAPSLRRSDTIELVSLIDQMMDYMTSKGTGEFYWATLEGWADVNKIKSLGRSSFLNAAYTHASWGAKTNDTPYVIVDGFTGRVVLTVYPDGSAEFNPEESGD